MKIGSTMVLSWVSLDIYSGAYTTIPKTAGEPIPGCQTHEMRLRGVSSLEEANRFLPGFLARYNRRFAVPPAEGGSAYRPLPEGTDPERVFCFKHTRTVGADNVVAFDHHRLQILADGERASYARLEVEVHRRLDGTLAVFHQGRRLGVREAPMEAAGLRSRPKEAAQLERASSPGSLPPTPPGADTSSSPGAAGTPQPAGGRRDGHLRPSRIAATLPSVRPNGGRNAGERRTEG
ncbi:MAG: hypothetical protein M1380_00970 [Chloroflexi bacterium]|nr:hypothetical protein [Chloroflexota bacterium]